MPIYQFVCPQGHQFEFFKFKSSEKEPKRCKKCKRKLTKVIGGTSWCYTKGKNKNWPIGTSTGEDPSK